MKNLKKVITLLLAVLMIASVFAGCGEKKPDTTTAAGGNNETTVAKTTDPVVEEPVELSFMTNNVLPEDSVSMAWVKKLEEKCNVKINWILPPSSGYSDQLQLTLLEDKLPDAMLIPTDWLKLPAFTDSVKNGRFMNIADMIGKYTNLMDHTAKVSWEAMDVLHDGSSVYGVPRSTMIRADGFVVIKEWCDACKIDYKEGDYLTVDEFYDMAYKFAHNDPDGNGVDDTFGFKAHADKGGVLWTGLEGAFNVGDGWTEESPGFYMTAKYSKQKGNYKRYLEFLHKCWENKVLDPDAFALKAKEASQRERNNMYGMWNAFAAGKDYEPGPDGRTTLLIPGVVEKEGDHYGSAHYSNGVWNFWVINAQCEHPEKILEIFDYILSDEGWQDCVGRGIEGVHYKIDADGNWDFSEWKEKSKDMSNDQKNTALLTQVVRRSDGADFFVDRSRPKEIRELSEKFIKIACDNVIPSQDRGFRPSIADDQIYIEYTSFMDDEINKIIAGERALDTYDELLDGWYKAGGQQYVDEMNAFITKMEAADKK